MQSHFPLHAFLTAVRRMFIWTLVGGTLLAGLFTSTDVWAQGIICFNNSSVPISPGTIFLKRSGATSYQLRLCAEPTEYVIVDATPAQPNRVVLIPDAVQLDATNWQTGINIATSVDPAHPVDTPFRVVITHTAVSEDPRYNYGAVNMLQVTAVYSPPVAGPDGAATNVGQAVTVNVLDDDIDNLGQGITLTVTSQPANGAVVINPDRTVTYTPNANFTGSNTFVYRITDAIGSFDEETVTIFVLPANVPPPVIDIIETVAPPPVGAEEAVVEFETPLGVIQVSIPTSLLAGFPAGAKVEATFGAVEEPAGNLDVPPPGNGTFTGIVFQFNIFVNGVLVTELDEPIVLAVAISDELGGKRILVAIWNGTQWDTSGINVLPSPTPIQAAGSAATNDIPLNFATTVLGEFTIFVQDVIYVPVVARPE